MSVLISYTVEGIPDPIKVHSEYTNTAVLDAWGNSTDGFFSVINSIFQKQKILQKDADGNVVSVTPSTISETDAINLIGALNDIKDVAVNGITVGGKTYYLSYEMAQSLDKVVKTLKAVGFDFTADPLNASDPKHASNVTALSYWVDLDDVGLRQIIFNAGQAVANSRSLQAMVELEYVRAGNELISSQMETLTNALEATKAALAILERAQTLKNKLQPNTVPSGANEVANIDDLKRRVELFTKEVTSAEAHRALSEPSSLGWIYNVEPQPTKSTVWTVISGIPISRQTGIPDSENLKSGVAAPAGSTASVAYGTFVEYFKSKFNHVFGTLIGVTVDASDIGEFQSIQVEMQKVVANLKAIGVDPNDPSTVAGAINKVLGDMSTGFPNWLLDGYEQQNFVKSGDFQRTLTEAITASESLNDTQKEDLRRFMFVFEQFYKSASALLQGIDRIINKMASGIKGN